MCEGTRSQSGYELTNQEPMIKCICTYEYIPEGVPVQCPRCKSIYKHEPTPSVDALPQEKEILWDAPEPTIPITGAKASHSRGIMNTGASNNGAISDMTNQPKPWEPLHSDDAVCHGTYDETHMLCPTCPDRNICYDD